MTAIGRLLITVIFVTERFARYSRHILHLRCPLLGSFTVLGAYLSYIKPKSFKPLAIFTESSILDIWLGPECALKLTRLLSWSTESNPNRKANNPIIQKQKSIDYCCKVIKWFPYRQKVGSLCVSDITRMMSFCILSILLDLKKFNETISLSFSKLIPSTATVIWLYQSKMGQSD